MQGALAAGWNPAILALDGSPRNSYLLPSAAITLGNNAYSPQFLSQVFIKGKHLTDGETSDLLGELKSGEWNIYGGGYLPLFGISSGAVALNAFDLHYAGSGSVPKDMFDLLFKGTETGRIYRLDNLSEESYGYWTIAFSGAKKLNPPPFFREFSIGGTVRYMRGLGYNSISRAGGFFQITSDTIHCDGSIQSLQAGTGDGVGLDLAVAGWLEPLGGSVGLTLGNLLGDIQWAGVTSRELFFSRHSGIDIDSVSRKGYWQNFFNDRDTSYSYGALGTPLPRYFLLAIRRSDHVFRRNGSWFVSWYQGLNKVVGNSTIPRLSVGQELSTCRWFAARAGVGVGGLEGFTLAGGVGLRFNRYKFDLGGSWHRGVMNGAKGFTLAVTNSLNSMPWDK